MGHPGAKVQHDDSRLIQDCLKGRQAAWDELVERYSRLIYSIPLRVGLSHSDADDVVQIVWGIVLRRLETLRECVPGERDEGRNQEEPQGGHMG